MTERVQVAVELAGQTVPAGVLHVDTSRGVSSTFAYDPAYLAAGGAYPLDPELPLHSSPSHVRGLPGAFADAAPDRWGRNLIRRRLQQQLGQRGSTPTEVDFLLGVSDHSRQGALRFSRDPGGPYLSDHEDTPKLLQMPRLMRAADRVARASEHEDDIKTLLDAGSGSLGGARPKASIVDGNTLYIAKFPHYQDQWDVMAWEATALDLARDAGVEPSVHRLVRLEEGSVLLVQRFDRDGDNRMGYLSAMALLKATDGQTLDYLDIAEELALVGDRPAGDLRQLWTRAAYSVAINNTDDHLRNHGFLRDSAGWRLAPAFDINPNPYPARRQTSIGGYTDREGCALALVESADSFGLTRGDTDEIVGRIKDALGRWRQVAAANGIPRQQAEMMADAFNTDAFPERASATNADRARRVEARGRNRRRIGGRGNGAEVGRSPG